ncbi:DUF4424 domain-containing protein [soil metagenome]
MKFSVASLLCLAFASGEALANGAMVEHTAGGLEFKQSDTVAILREDLFVSTHKVTVHYLYESTATTPQTVEIAFPMPPIPVNQDPDSISENRAEGFPPENYMGFMVSVDGKPVTAQAYERALVGDVDVTAKVKSAGLPLHMLVDDVAGTLKKLPQAARDGLVAAGALSMGEGEDPFYWPQWQYQTVFGWTQTIPAGRTTVDITYAPLAGYPSDTGDEYEMGDAAKEACVDGAVRQALKKRKDAGAPYEVASVGYVLTTAKYWKGPIREFNLTVEKSDANELAAFCPPDAKKVSPVRFEWHAKDFAPTRDLRALFYSFQTPE